MEIVCEDVDNVVWAITAVSVVETERGEVTELEVESTGFVELESNTVDVAFRKLTEEEVDDRVLEDDKDTTVEL